MGYSAPVETFLWHFFSGMTLYLQFRIESNFINAHLSKIEYWSVEGTAESANLQ